MASTVKVKLIGQYPFSDNSNVFDASENSHGIENFVNSFPINTTIEKVADINLSQGFVRLALDFETANNYNYMVITKGSRKYYCFINDVIWENNLVSATIKFTLDIWNTYRNDIIFKQSFIEREHVANDAIGLHTIDEGLAPSNYKTYYNTFVDGGEMLPFIAIGATEHIVRDSPADPRNATPARAIRESDGYGYNPLLLGIRDISNWTRTSAITEISKIVRWLTEANSAEAIIGIYLLPIDRVVKDEDVYIIKDMDSSAMSNHEAFSSYVATFPNASTINNATNSYSIRSSINGYTPANNKCYNYPYNFIAVSNQLGNELVLKFENSSASEHRIILNIRKDGNINGTMYAVANAYDGISGNNLDYSIQSLNYPTIPYIIDTYDSYMSANKNVLANSKNYIENDYNFAMTQGALEAETTQTLSQVNNVMSAIGSGGVGAVGNVVKSVTDLYAQQNSAQLKINQLNYSADKARDSFKSALADVASKPDKYCGRYIPNLLLFYYKFGFVIKYTGAVYEQITAIDNYFSKYGYRVNRFDVPYLWYRPVFDYKKIPDCNITGNLPTDVLNTVKGLFQAGITIWHNKDTIFDYDEDNSPYTPPT